MLAWNEFSRDCESRPKLGGGCSGLMGCSCKLSGVVFPELDNILINPVKVHPELGNVILELGKVSINLVEVLSELVGSWSKC